MDQGVQAQVEARFEEATSDEAQNINQDAATIATAPSAFNFDSLRESLQSRNPIAAKMLAQKEKCLKIVTLTIFKSGDTVYEDLSIRDLFLKVKLLIAQQESSPGVGVGLGLGVLNGSSDSSSHTGQLQYRSSYMQ